MIPKEMSGRSETLELETLDDPALGEIVGAHLDLHPVTGQKTDVIHPHTTGNVGQDLVPRLQADPERRAWQCLDHFPFQTDHIFFVLSHIADEVPDISGPCLLPYGRFRRISKK